MRRSFRRFAADAQHPADRRAQFLVLAVDAAKPTTRPPLPLQQLGLQSLDVLAPRFCFLWQEHPADPFIAGKRGEVFPRSENLWVGNQDASQIHRDCMYHSAGDRPGAHRVAHHSFDAVEGSLEAGAAPAGALDLDVARARPALRALVALDRAVDRLLGRRKTPGAQTWPAGVAPALAGRVGT